jgi:hypothetical protein
MSNTLARDCNRQLVSHFVGEYSLADFVAADDVIDIALPVNAIVLDCDVSVTTVSNDSGTDTLIVGHPSDDNAFITSFTLKTASMVASLAAKVFATAGLGGYKTTASTNVLRLTRTAQNDDATTLNVRVTASYIEVGKSDFTQD